MAEGLVAEPRSAASPRFVRVRLWPLPASVQLLRRVVSEVLGVEPAESFPLVLVSPVDGIGVLPARRRLEAHLRVPLSALLIEAPDGVAGDDAGHLIATVSTRDPAADTVRRLRRGWGVDVSALAWLRLTAAAAVAAAARSGPLEPRLAGTRLAGARLVFAGLDVDRPSSS